VWCGVIFNLVFGVVALAVVAPDTSTLALVRGPASAHTEDDILVEATDDSSPLRPQPKREATTALPRKSISAGPSTSAANHPTSTSGASTSTTAPAPDAFEVTRKHGYWLADPDEPSARWLMPIVNSGDSWSPDGRFIAYRSSWVSISIIDVVTGESRVLVDGSPSVSDPLWSPDGQHIAMHETEIDQPPALVIVDLEGNEVARYAEWVDGQNGYAWSPDGDRIAFASYNHHIDEAWLSVATLGEPSTKLATANGEHRFLGLEWSPQGTYLGWSYDEDLHLLKLATGERRDLHLAASPVYGHAWSPDEHHFVVWGNRLFWSSADGSDLRLLDLQGHNASIDPVTGRIAWTTGYGAGKERVIMSAPDGSQHRVVLTTTTDSAIDGVMWSPAGGQFLFIEYG
jgi:dipeptidyl aminopeptidase/acylaminoacyl peptidase